MSKEHELPSDSDDDDEDYVPRRDDSEVGSEVESEGDAESGRDEENNDNLNETKIQSGREKRRKGSGKSDATGSKRKKSKKNRVGEDGVENKSSEQIDGEKKLSEEEEKKRADSLWADFMKDTPLTSKTKPKSTTNGTREKSSTSILGNEESKTRANHEIKEKVKITKLFEFAGEEVRVEKEVLADSAEARLTLPSSVNSKQDSILSISGGSRGRGIRKSGLGGISSVLGQLGKKAKISVLEKSKLDWDSYKKEENIEEEISTHNKGKGGYLEKQDFLQRADLRQFEIEKEMRTSRRSTR